MKKTTRRASASRVLAGVALATAMTTATPAMAQSDAGDASAIGDIAAVDGLRVARTDGTLAVLNWRPPAGADSHRIVIDDRSYTSENGWLTVRFLEPLQTYTASVSATINGQVGPAEQITFTTSDVTLRDPRIAVDDGTFRLSQDRVPIVFAGAPFTSVELFRDGVRLDPAELGDRYFRLLDSNVTPGETYAYQARLVSDASGEVGPFGPELTVTVPGGAPALTIPYADNSVAVLRIEGIEPRTAIDIERDGEYIGVFPRSGGGNSHVAWFSDRELRPFAPRTYRVRAVSSNGEVGPWSEPITSMFTGVQLAS